MANTVTVTSIDRLVGSTWSAMTAGATDTAGVYNDLSASAVTTYFGVEHDTMTAKIITMGGTSTASDPTRYRLTLTCNFQPSFFYSFTQPYVGTGSEEALALPSGYDLDDFDMTSGFYPTLVTQVGASWTVKMHLYSSEISCENRFEGSSVDNLFLNLSLEEASRDVAWDTGTTMADVLDAYPNAIGDNEEAGDHQAVDENGDSPDDMGGPPGQCLGMTVYTNTEQWNLIMDSQTGRGAMMGIRALGLANGPSKLLRMYVPYQLAQWMGVNVANTITILDAAGAAIDDPNAEVVRIDTTGFSSSANFTATTIYRRGFMFEVPIDFSQHDVFSQGQRGLARATTAATFLIGQGTNPCFHGTTEIDLVNDKRIRVDALKQGHRVRTADGKAHTVRAVLSTTTDRAIVFRPGAFGENLPSRRLIVTANHLIRLPDGRTMSAADAMSAVVESHRARWLVEPMTVYHVCLNDWTWLDVGGIQAETCAWLPEHHDTRPKLRVGQHAATYTAYQNFVSSRA